MEPTHNDSVVYCKPCDSGHFIQSSHWSYQMQHCTKHWDCPGPGMWYSLSGEFLVNLHHLFVRVTLLIIFWQFI